MTNNASMEEVYKAEVETLRKVLAEKEQRIKKLERIILELGYDVTQQKFQEFEFKGFVQGERQ